MTRKFGLLAGAAFCALLAAAAPAMAQDNSSAAAANGTSLTTSGVRGFRAGDFLIGASVIGVLPTSGGAVNVVGGTVHASDSWTAQLDFTYFMTRNFSLNLIAATTQHDLEVRGAPGTTAPIRLGHVWALPPTLTLQYHPIPDQRFSPYVGVGINYTVFYGEGGTRTPGITSVDVRNAAGVAFNAGLNIELAPNWVLNFDAKYIYLRTSANVDLGPTTRIGANANIDPWVVGAGIRYRF